MPEIRIRKMVNSDFGRIMQIWLDSNVNVHSFIPADYWYNQYDNVKRLIPDAEVYVCEKGSEIVGFVGLVAQYVAGLFVDSAYRSQKIGKQLLDYAKSCKSHLELHVYKKNCRAIQFYTREGFVNVGESIDDDTGEPEILMRYAGG